MTDDNALVSGFSPQYHLSPISYHLRSYLCRMGEYSIGEALQKFLDESRIKGSIQALQIEDVWGEIMGKTIAKYTDSIGIINDTLFITTHVAPLKQELIFQKEKIKLRVNEALGKNVIKEIIVK
jgi:hypothetical protein